MASATLIFKGRNKHIAVSDHAMYVSRRGKLDCCVENMRNVLTQYQTNIIEASSALSSSAEDSLNAILNVQTADEIKTFAMKSVKVMPKAQRRMSLRQDSQPPPSTDAGPSLAPVASLPQPDDESSHRSNSCKYIYLRCQKRTNDNARSSRTFRTT